MSGTLRNHDGVVAGLMGGGAVVAFFFVYDLLRLEPFATPSDLSWIVDGSSAPSIDLPVASRLVTLVAFSTRLLAYTLLHFAVFAALGLAAVLGSRRLGIKCNVVTGAIYGLLVCTAVFYGSMSFGEAFVARPGWPAVLTANVLAGSVIGGYLWLRGATRQPD